MANLKDSPKELFRRIDRSVSKETKDRLKIEINNRVPSLFYIKNGDVSIRDFERKVRLNSRFDKKV